MKNYLPLTFALLFASSLFAEPPCPPEGMRWILQEEFSDEFNGNQLDKDKWNDYYPGWVGRPPAKFVRENVSVKNGLLVIQNTPLKNPDETFHIAGGAVTTKSDEAHFGYYECRAKASRINMSTTFWMSNGKVLLDETTDCLTDTFSQELDIQEAIGGTQKVPSFRTQMHSNTHYRHVACGETKEKFYSKGAQAELHSEVWEEFHTYGAWWMDEEQVKFYANDEFFSLVRPSQEISQKPFPRGMHINMVTETYNWNPAPTIEELLNEEINKSYYDWVRSYRLVPVAEEIEGQSNQVKLYDEDVAILAAPLNIFDGYEYEITYSYKANVDRKIVFEIFDGRFDVVQTEEWNVWAGYGQETKLFKLAFDPVQTKNYRIRLSIVDQALEQPESDSENDKTPAIDWADHDVSL